MKVFTLLTVCAALATPAFAQAPPSSLMPPARLEMRDVMPFPDVPPGHWAASAVETLHQAGIVRGYPATGKPTSALRPQTARRQAKTTVKH